MDHLRAVPSGAPVEGAPEAPALADLLKRSARGDTEAFAAFYDATSAPASGPVTSHAELALPSRRFTWGVPGWLHTLGNLSRNDPAQTVGRGPISA